MSATEIFARLPQERKFSPLNRSTLTWRRPLVTSFIVFMETAALITLVVLIGRLCWGKAGFSALNPNPLWIPVMLMSAHYGAVSGALAAFGGTLALYGVAMPLRLSTQDFYSYASVLAWQPTQWLTYAIVIGGLRSLQRLHAARTQNSLDDSTQATLELADGLERALAEINRLERRIAEDSGTLNATLRSLAKISYHDTDAVISGYAPLISDALGATRFTVYLRSSEGLKPCFRFDHEGDGGVSAVPSLGASLWEEFETGREIVSPDSTGPMRASSGALCAVPIKCSENGAPFGVLLIERLRPNRKMAEVLKRLRLLSLALGSALHATMKRENTPEPSSE